MQRTIPQERLVPGRCGSLKFTKPLLAHFMIRGVTKGAETASIAECGDMVEVVSRAAETFPHFHQRNPWIFGDSVQCRAFVLIDPDTAVLKSQGGEQRS